MINKTYQVKNMHCASCALLIEGDLEDVGVKANCNYAKAMLEVEFDEDKISEDKVKKVVKTTGYDLT